MARPKFTLCLTILLALSSTIAAQSGCYWRNGTENPNEGYAPCKAPNLSTICCFAKDVCLDNGLCYSDRGYYWRETCTSSNWDTGECQDLCSYSATQQAHDQVVTPCDGTANSSTWCCGRSNACCGSDSPLPRYTIAERFGVSASATGSTGISTITSTTSTQPATSSTASSATSSAVPKTGMSTGTKAGIGIGAAVGALALVGLGIFIAKAQRGNNHRANGDAVSHYEPVQYKAPMIVEGDDTHVLELEHPTAEVSTENYGKQTAMHELSASNER